LDTNEKNNFTSIYEGRENIHLKLDDALANYLKNSDQKVWDKERKDANSKFSEYKKQISESLKKFKHDEVISRILQEIENNQKEKEDLQKSLHDLLIEHKTKKTDKSARENHIQYMTEEVISKEDQIDNSIDLLFGNLTNWK